MIKELRLMIAIYRKRILRLRKRSSENSKKHTVINAGILYICVGKYDIFFKSFYKSVTKNFIKEAHKTFFVFTDSKKLIESYKHHQNIVFIHTEKKGWPYDTLLRNRYFKEYFDRFNGMDFLFFCNANMICNQEIFLDDLGLGTHNKIFGVLQPYYFHKQSDDFPVESKLRCNAHFDKWEIPKIRHYFQGCFYGGNYIEFSHLVETIYQWTEEDLKENKIPVWHDESYLNRYFYLYPPFALHPGFAYPENVNLPFRKYIVMLQKSNQADHSKLRS